MSDQTNAAQEEEQKTQEPRESLEIQEAPPTVPASERPSWLPEKFKSPEEMAKSYAELEKKLGNPKESAPPKSEKQESPEQVSELIDLASQELLSNNEISKETYEKFKEAGIPQSLVDEVVAGRKTQADNYTKDVKAAAGGEKEWNLLSQWASETLNSEERQAFNDAVNSGNIYYAKMAVTALKAQYKESFSNGRESLKVAGAGRSGPAGFTSKSEYIQAMKDPRYATDQSYRDSIVMRLQLTPDGIV